MNVWSTRGEILFFFLCFQKGFNEDLKLDDLQTFFSQYGKVGSTIYFMMSCEVGITFYILKFIPTTIADRVHSDEKNWPPGKEI